MITPFLDHAPGFTQFTSDGVNSGQSCIDAIRTALLSVGWTEPGAAYTLYSPARTDCVQLRITLGIGSSATQITFIVREHAGRLVNNDTLTRMNVPVSTVHNIYYGDTYVYFEVNTQTNMWGAALLHREPDNIAEPVPVYFASIGPRNNADTTAYNFLVYNNWISAGGAGDSGNNNMWMYMGSGWDNFSVQGSMIFQPMEWCQSASWFWGRLPNVLRLDSTQYAGNTFELPLDETTVGTFRVVRSGTSASSVLAVRIS